MKIIINNIVPLESWQKKVKDKKYLRPVFLLDNYLKKNVSEELVGFYLHGSLASLDYVPGYSDVDTIVLIRSGSEKSPTLKKKLRKINKFSFLIDLLQHHPASLIEEKELENYRRADLPLNLLKGAVALGNSKLQLRAEIDDVDFSVPLRNFYEDLKKAYLKKIYPKTAQDLKVFLSVIQLLPALYLQAKNKSWVNKKESFQLAEKDFGREWEVIEKATRVRNVWRYSPVFSPAIQDLLLRTPNLKRIAWLYGKVIMPLPKEVKKIVGSNLVEESYRLAETMMRKSIGSSL